jgi:hypothetical protein
MYFETVIVLASTNTPLGMGNVQPQWAIDMQNNINQQFAIVTELGNFSRRCYNASAINPTDRIYLLLNQNGVLPAEGI